MQANTIVKTYKLMKSVPIAHYAQWVHKGFVGIYVEEASADVFLLARVMKGSSSQLRKLHARKLRV